MGQVAAESLLPRGRVVDRPRRSLSVAPSRTLPHRTMSSTDPTGQWFLLRTIGLATQRYLEQPSLTPLYRTRVGRRSALPSAEIVGDHEARRRGRVRTPPG